MQKVLIVDDMASVRASLATCLQGMAVSISFAEDGAAALKLLRSEKFDVALLDLHMPVLDGPQLIRLLRGNPVPCDFIFVTASASRAALADLFKLGVSDYIAKPFRCEEVREKVARALAKRRRAADQATPSVVALSARPARDLLVITGDVDLRGRFPGLLPPNLSALYAEDSGAAVKQSRLFSFRAIIVDPLLPGLEWKAVGPLQSGALVFAIGDAGPLNVDHVLPSPVESAQAIVAALAADAAQVRVEDAVVHVGPGGGSPARGYRRAADFVSDTIGRLGESGARGVIVDLIALSQGGERLIQLVLQLHDWTAEHGMRLLLVGTPATKAALSVDVAAAAVPFFEDLEIAREALRYFEEE